MYILSSKRDLIVSSFETNYIWFLFTIGFMLVDSQLKSTECSMITIAFSILLLFPAKTITSKTGGQNHSLSSIVKLRHS